MGIKCLKSFLVCLHGLIALASCFFCLYSEFSKDNLSSCVPNLVDHWKGLIQFKNGLPIICDSLVYGMGAVSALNFIMCVVNICLLNNTCVAFFHAMLTSIYMVYSVMGGTVVSIYYLVWCDVLQNEMTGSKGCNEAATKYDNFNATAHMSENKTRMEIQMAIIWTLLPLTSFALLTYMLVFHWLAAGIDTDGDSTHIRYIIVQDETTPLLSPLHRSASATRAPAGISNQPVSMENSASQQTV